MGREKKRQEEEKKSGHMSCKSIKGKMRILRASKLENARGSDEVTALSCMMYTNNGSIHDTPYTCTDNQFNYLEKVEEEEKGGD